MSWRDDFRDHYGTDPQTFMDAYNSMGRELDEVHAEHHQACIDRDERLTLEESSRLAFRADRYRLAWTSARRRSKRLRGVAFLALFKQDVAEEAARRYKVGRDEARAQLHDAGVDVRTLRDALEVARAELGRLAEQKRHADLRSFPDA